MKQSEKSMRFRCNCGGQLFVRETRALPDVIYRTRKCADCNWIYTTEERAIEGYIPVEARNAWNTKK